MNKFVFIFSLIVSINASAITLYDCGNGVLVSKASHCYEGASIIKVNSSNFKLYDCGSGVIVSSPKHCYEYEFAEPCDGVIINQGSDEILCNRETYL